MTARAREQAPRFARSDNRPADIRRGLPNHPMAKNPDGELRSIVVAPYPLRSCAACVAQRLLDEGLVAVVQLRSPFPSDQGAMIDHLQATDEGRARAERSPQWGPE